MSRVKALLLALILGSVIFGTWAYFQTDEYARYREKLHSRDACFNEVHRRYKAYVESNQRQQPDGSYSLSKSEKRYIDNWQKEEYAACSQAHAP
jgi:hypothetical protein